VEIGPARDDESSGVGWKWYIRMAVRPGVDELCGADPHRWHVIGRESVADDRERSARDPAAARLFAGVRGIDQQNPRPAACEERRGPRSARSRANNCDVVHGLSSEQQAEIAIRALAPSPWTLCPDRLRAHG